MEEVISSASLRAQGVTDCGPRLVSVATRVFICAAEQEVSEVRSAMHLVCSQGHNSNLKEAADEITVKLSRNKNTQPDQ